MHSIPGDGPMTNSPRIRVSLQAAPYAGTATYLSMSLCGMVMLESVVVVDASWLLLPRSSGVAGGVHVARVPCKERTPRICELRQLRAILRRFEGNPAAVLTGARRL